MSVPEPGSAALEAVRTRNLRTVLALAGLFVLPLVASFWLYYGTGWRPAGHTNHGELITPARPLPPAMLLRAPAGGEVSAAKVFGHDWTLVAVAPGECDASCRHTLFVMRQTRLGLGASMTRVQRVFLASSQCCAPVLFDAQNAGLTVLDASGPTAQPLLAMFPPDARSDMIFIVDPLGNLMMRYDARTKPRGLLEDLKRLLQLSHIG